MALLGIVVVLTALGAAGLVGWSTRRASSPAELHDWARSDGLALTPANRAAVTYYVRLVIVTRVVGAVAGVIIGSSFDAALGSDTSAAPGWWAWLIGGWTFGAWWAERELRWPPGSGMASLLPRRAADYLPGRLRAAPYVAFGLVVVLAAAGALAADPDALQRQSGYDPAPSAAHLLALVAAAAAVTALTKVTVWRIVSRRQPPLAADVLAADDAIRTSAAHQVTGGGTAVVLCIAASLTGALAWTASTPQALNGTLGLLGLVLWLGALVSWRYYTYRAWRVRRVVTPGTGAVAVAT